MSAWAKIECSSCSAAMWAPRSSASQETAAKPKCRRCVLGLTTNETCMICFEKVKVGVKLNHRSDACEHPCCLTCMRTYLFYKIEDGVFNIRCPHEGCGMQYYEGDMRKILGPSMHIVEDAKTREKCQQALERVKVFLRQEHGGHLVEVLRQALLQQKKQRLQPALGQEECTEAHQRDEDCASSSASSTASPSSAAAVSEDSEEQHQDDGLHHFGAWALDACQACPSCNVIVRKEEGCDHITCRCGAHFCYGCGAPMDGKCVCSDRRTASRLGTHSDLRLGFWLRKYDRINLDAQPIEPALSRS